MRGMDPTNSVYSLKLGSDLARDIRKPPLLNLMSFRNSILHPLNFYINQVNKTVNPVRNLTMIFPVRECIKTLSYQILISF